MSIMQFDVAVGGWQSLAQPVKGSARFPDWKAINRIIVHYPGADWSDMDFNNDGRIDAADTAYMLRQTQDYYTRTRGYSIGYNCIIGQEGLSWEARGDTWMNAANVGDGDDNRDSFSINLFVDDQAKARPRQVRKARFIIAQARYLSGKPLPVVGHGDIGSTSCPGAGIKSQLARGAFEPR